MALIHTYFDCVALIYVCLSVLIREDATCLSVPTESRIEVSAPLHSIASGNYAMDPCFFIIDF